MRRILIACSASLAALSLAGCVSVKDGALHVMPAASVEEVDAVKQHVDTEVNALRSEAQNTEAKLRADMAAGDQAVRADAAAQLAEGRKAYEAAIAAGKTQAEALAAKWQTEVDEATKRAADAKVIADANAKASADLGLKLDAESKDRQAQVQALIDQVRSGHLSLTDLLAMLGIGVGTSAGGATILNSKRNRTRQQALALVAGPKVAAEAMAPLPRA